MSEALRYSNDSEEAIHKSTWESMRAQTMIWLNSNLPKKDRYKNPQSLIRFAWEENYHSNKQQSVQEQVQILDHLFGKRKKKGVGNGK